MSKIDTWRFATTTESAWEYMLTSWDRAKKSIDIEQYIFGSDGPMIEEATQVLVRKASEGVRVRLLLDAVGSFSFFQSRARSEMEEAGIEMVFHRTVVPPSLKRVVPAFLRDHRKLIIVDGKEALIGGVIIEERARSWRDTSVIFQGSLVEACIEIFETAWQKADQMKPVGEVLTHDGKGEFYLAGNSYRLRDKDLYRTLVKKLATAKRSINITTPYFALTRDLRRALLYARSQGVEIRILLPRRSDNLPSDIVGRFFYAELLRHDIKLFHYTRSILHAKTTTVDGSWGTIGSCNLDWLSTWLNYELNLVGENTEFVADLDAHFEKDISESEEVTWETKGWWGMWGN